MSRCPVGWDAFVGEVAGLDLRAECADYNSYGAEGGLRYHFTESGMVRPYMALVGGVKVILERHVRASASGDARLEEARQQLAHDVPG